MHSAILMRTAGKLSAGIQSLTLAFETAVRYLPSDRLELLQMIQLGMEQSQLSAESVIKHQKKFEKNNLHVSIIVNCEDKY